MFWFNTLGILSLSISVHNQETNENYGPYKMSGFNIETCKGPKRGDCGKVHIEGGKNLSDINYDVDLPIDCPVSKTKVVVSSNEIKSKKKMWNYVVDNPCQHFFFGPFLNEYFNVTEKACKVNKGYYGVHLNMHDISKKFLGSSFFYGNYTFKSFAYNKVNNFFCFLTTVVIEKR